MTRLTSPRPSLRSSLRSSLRPIALAVALVAASSIARAEDRSAPAMLQMFESSWTNVQRRAPDLFMAGYGGLWIPPAGRAETGNLSVGYDVYDRFDLGNADNPTLYGTEGTLKRAIGEVHRFGVNVYADEVLNHDGFADQANTGFAASGGYPGFVLSAAGAPNGDFHANQSLGDSYLNGRLAGLIDIDQSANLRYVRNPIPNAVDANGTALRNLPAGTGTYNGRRANVATEANRRFYQDRNRTPDRMLYNPTTGQADIPVWDYTPDTATAGDAVEENSTQYLMRNAQWMLQNVGVDGFRLDAVKHFPVSLLNDSFDLAVYRANPRLNLDGSRKSVFSYGEVYDGDKAFVQTHIRKDINPATPGVVGGNRDVLDHALFFAFQGNLTNNGLNNDWRNVVNASQDVQDDGLANNGSQGVAFATSHDDGGVYLSNVAHAYMLMRPGNAVVYLNAKEFGSGRDFPKDGRSDALGGLYGSAVTKLTNLRNTHGRGNYAERWLDKETLVYEREKSAVVALSNRIDNGYDNRTVQTAFTPGTRLLEMTGNAADATVDPTGQIADYVVVDANGRINFNLPRNKNVNGVEHDKGYVIYGLPTASGTLSLVGKDRTVAGGAPTAATNGTTRLAALDVVTAETFTVRLQTASPVIGGYTDVDAGGDHAIFTINGGMKADGTQNDLNGNGGVDFVNPANDVNYGFEEFATKASPLVGGGVGGTAGDGEYRQAIDVAKLVEGFNYLEARVFRHRTDGGPAVYASFKDVVYVDRFKPVSQVDSINNVGGNSRTIRINNTDGTGDNVHVLLDVGAALTDAQVLALVGGGSQATQVDAGLWSRQFDNVGTGNHAITYVTFEPDGNYSVSRASGRPITTGRGRGLGDVNYDGSFTAADATGAGSFDTFLYSRSQQFNAAADVNGDGFNDDRDLFLLPGLYAAAGATAAVNSVKTALVRRANVDGDAVTTAADIDFLYGKVGSTTGDTWLYDIDVDGLVTLNDVDTLVRTLLQTTYGDSNLDRKVDFSDLLTVSQSYGGAGTWATGDFNGDGSVSFEDLLALAQNYNFVATLRQGDTGLAGTSGSTFVQDWALAQSLVPEPATLALVPLSAAIGFRRRRTVAQ